MYFSMSVCHDVKTTRTTLPRLGAFSLSESSKVTMDSVTVPFGPHHARALILMATQLLSEYEREYIVAGVNQDLREDGRNCRDYRHFSLRTGVVSNTSGSARIQLENTSAVVGVKAELGTPDPSQPSAGRLEFFVDCSALASPQFEGRGGEELGHHLAHQLSQAYGHHSAIDRESLCIISGQQCWILYVDVLVLEWSGSVLDVLSLAVRAALHSTRIPRLTVTGEGEELEVEVSDNPHDSTPINITHAPIIITLTQIGDNFVVDVNMKEEMCASSRVSLAINEEGQTLSMSKDVQGGIPYYKLYDVIMMAQEVSKEVFHKLNSCLQESEELGRTNTQLFT